MTLVQTRTVWRVLEVWHCKGVLLTTKTSKKNNSGLAA